ncbi:MAG: thiol reductase thioredoxin [Alphaproteobacteria bacterium]|uniref:thioredoxin family protein n=1 Tax=Hyphomonas sp. TaxID=87 RepID=UPI001E0B01AC|nr:thioredoxin domain-containing protein [Hyphomonas sp.]MBU3922423.1 thiol reductase thioredoxin [Alphaproteobacteria bacterium]MBU4062689.1 thiol reductase thioredoxin [Alphaproteobacteria bacterium]MBU4166197.1 thiol reductase thioredoxin [Alphaproteobacteria bacterium]MBU4567569.1 thiol reductase thioredoxin [Alphaproteobacteria bacterium]
MSATEQMIFCLSCGSTNRVGPGKSLSSARCGRCGKGLATPEPAEVTADQLVSLQSKDTGAFVLDVWAPWCGPCRMMAPHYEAAAAKFNGEVRFFKLNTDNHQTAAAQLQIRGVPTLIGWKGGRQVAHQAGAQTGRALETWIQTAFNVSSPTN